MAAVLAAACSSGGAPGADAGPTSAPAAADLPFEAPDGIDPAILAPLEGLGRCPQPPPDVLDVDPSTLGLPPAALVTQLEESGPLTNVQGWIGWTPVQLRVWYQHLSDLDIVQGEDEVFESEILLRTGDGRRLYVKAQARCADASIFVAILAPEDAAGSVPTPAGSPSPATG